MSNFGHIFALTIISFCSAIVLIIIGIAKFDLARDRIGFLVIGGVLVLISMGGLLTLLRGHCGKNKSPSGPQTPKFVSVTLNSDDFEEEPWAPSGPLRDGDMEDDFDTL